MQILLSHCKGMETSLCSNNKDRWNKQIKNSSTDPEQANLCLAFVNMEHSKNKKKSRKTLYSHKPYLKTHPLSFYYYSKGQFPIGFSRLSSRSFSSPCGIRIGEPITLDGKGFINLSKCFFCKSCWPKLHF